jgi:hypothetical protein
MMIKSYGSVDFLAVCSPFDLLLSFRIRRECRINSMLLKIST